MRKTVYSKALGFYVLSAIYLVFSVLAFTQSDVGTVIGFVKDQSGAVAVSAKVVIKNEGTGEEHVVTSDTQGHYTAPNLVPGLYTMTVELRGFKKFTSTHNKLSASSTLSLDANLVIGATTETIEVSDTASVLQTESGAVRSEITAQQVQNQELNGRNPLYIAQLLPGVRSGSTLGATSISQSEEACPIASTERARTTP
jgi:Carboxypeptidase regulatory-like domain